MTDQEVMQEAPKKPSVDELRREIESEKQERAQKCGMEINKILEKYNCILDVKMVLSKSSIDPEIRVLAKDSQQG